MYQSTLWFSSVLTSFCRFKRQGTCWAFSLDHQCFRHLRAFRKPPRTRSLPVFWKVHSDDQPFTCRKPSCAAVVLSPGFLTESFGCQIGGIRCAVRLSLKSWNSVCCWWVISAVRSGWIRSPMVATMPVNAVWPVFIDSSGDGLLTSGEQVTATDANGKYLFAGLTAGNVRVGTVVQPGFTPLAGRQSVVTVAVRDRRAVTADFPMVTAAVVTGRVTRDDFQRSE